MVPSALMAHALNVASTEKRTSYRRGVHPTTHLRDNFDHYQYTAEIPLTLTPRFNKHL